jgi:hypothetical protein
MIFNQSLIIIWTQENSNRNIPSSWPTKFRTLFQPSTLEGIPLSRLPGIWYITRFLSKSHLLSTVVSRPITMEETSATSIALYTLPISIPLHQGCFIMRPRKAYIAGWFKNLCSKCKVTAWYRFCPAVRTVSQDIFDDMREDCGLGAA